MGMYHYDYAKSQQFIFEQEPMKTTPKSQPAVGSNKLDCESAHGLSLLMENIRGFIALYNF